MPLLHGIQMDKRWRMGGAQADGTGPWAWDGQRGHAQ
jgi:hypothetical protein